MAIAEPLYYLPLERYTSTTKDISSGRVYCAIDAPSPQWRFTRLAIVLSCLVAIIANPCSTRICNDENRCFAQLFNCKQAFANMQTLLPSIICNYGNVFSLLILLTPYIRKYGVISNACCCMFVYIQLPKYLRFNFSFALFSFYLFIHSIPLTTSTFAGQP